MNNSPEASFKLDLWNIITETYEQEYIENLNLWKPLDIWFCDNELINPITIDVKMSTKFKLGNIIFLLFILSNFHLKISHYFERRGGWGGGVLI